MNYRFKKADDLFEKTGKSLIELVDVLNDINENDPVNIPNETTISGDNGERIVLSIEQTAKGTHWVITKDSLKLEMYLPK